MPKRKRKPITAWAAGGQTSKRKIDPEKVKAYLKAIAKRDGTEGR